MDSERVRLLGAWPSPFVLRTRIALNIKLIQYEFIDENVWASKSELLQKSNPVHKRVPVLFHGDRTPLCESLIILEYVDQVWSYGPSIIPDDPHDRAIARFWGAYIDKTWFPNIPTMLLGSEEEVKNAALELAQGLALLEEAFTNCSKGQTFFGGSEIGYLDIAFGSFLAWVSVLEIRNSTSFINESSTPNLFKWARAFSGHSAVKDVLPETRKLKEFTEYLVTLLKDHGRTK